MGNFTNFNSIEDLALASKKKKPGVNPKPNLFKIKDKGTDFNIFLRQNGLRSYNVIKFAFEQYSLLVSKYNEINHKLKNLQDCSVKPDVEDSLKDDIIKSLEASIITKDKRIQSLEDGLFGIKPNNKEDIASKVESNNKVDVQEPSAADRPLVQNPIVIKGAQSYWLSSISSVLDTKQLNSESEQPKTSVVFDRKEADKQCNQLFEDFHISSESYEGCFESLTLAGYFCCPFKQVFEAEQL
jgi:hypothetical protein